MNFQKILSEFKRRNIFRVATVYSVAGWLIIQIIDVINEPLNLPEKFDTISIILIAIGLPMAMIFAWVFELTPIGIKKTDEIEVSPEYNFKTGRRLNRLFIAFLSLALTLLIIERVFFVGSGLYNDIEPSIAVLPFVNMSSDKDNEYFSDGISEELLNGLAKISSIKVAARTSAFSFKGKNQDLRTVGQLLDVAYILEGSVRKDDNTLRITAQLIRASDGYHVWSETFDREMESIFEIQSEISRIVVDKLRISLLPNESIENIPTNSSEAYEAYLRATQLEVTRQDSKIDSAILYYQKAISLDSKFSLAYARLAYAYSIKNEYSNLGIETMEPLMRENIEKSLLLDPNLAQAYEALGSLYFRKSRSILFDSTHNQQALNSYKKAYELQPTNASILASYQMALAESTDPNEMNLKYIEQAIEIDPLNPRLLKNYAVYLREKGNYDQAISTLERIVAIEPEFPGTYTTIGSVYLKFGKLDSTFMINFEGYLNTGNEVEILVALAAYSSDLGLYNLSDYYYHLLVRHYPDHSDTHLYRIFIWPFQGKYNQLKPYHHDFTKFLDSKFGSALLIKYQLTHLFYEGQYSKGLELMNEFYQQNTDDFDDHPIETVFSDIPYFLIKAGKTDLIGTFISVDSVANSMKENYFVHHQSDVLRHLNFSTEASFCEGEPPYDEVRDMILTDQKRMRDNVITYLKKEGEWLKEWEKDD